MATDTVESTDTQDVDALHRDFPDWRFWPGHDGHGQLHGWHATRRTPDGCALVVTDGPEQLRVRVAELEAKATARR